MAQACDKFILKRNGRDYEGKGYAVENTSSSESAGSLPRVLREFLYSKFLSVAEAQEVGVASLECLGWTDVPGAPRCHSLQLARVPLFSAGARKQRCGPPRGPVATSGRSLLCFCN